MTLILTRSPSDNAPLVAAAETAGIRTLEVPVLQEVRRTPLPPGTEGVSAVIFTSRRALDYTGFGRFLALPCFCVGPATAQAAREAGFTKVVEGPGDGGGLARLICSAVDPSAGPVVHFCGLEHRPEPVATLTRAGFTLQRCIVYEMRPATGLPPALAPVLADALAEGGRVAALFYSPRTAQVFEGLAVDAGLADALAAVTAVCLSTQVAGVLTSSLWQRTVVAGAPTEDALLVALDRSVGYHLQDGKKGP